MVSKTEYEMNDQKLVMEVRENNEEAKDHIYEKYSPLIHKEINRVKSRAYALGIDMADLSQEAMLAFSHAINNYKDEETTMFMTFAVLCIRRRLANYVEKYDTQKNKTMNKSLSLDIYIDDEKNTLIDMLEEIITSDPLKKLITNESLEEISHKIKYSLTENERKVLLYDLEGRSIEEISKSLDMSSKQIYNLLYRARKKLKL